MQPMGIEATDIRHFSITGFVAVKLDSAVLLEDRKQRRSEI